MPFYTIEGTEKPDLNAYMLELTCDIRPTLQTVCDALNHGEHPGAAANTLEACLARWENLDDEIKNLRQKRI